MCRSRGLKAHGGKNKVMVLNSKEVLECEASVDRMRFEFVLEFK